MKVVVMAALVSVATSMGCQTVAVPEGGGLLAAPSFVALRVQDVHATSTWYRDVFGLAEVGRLDAEDGRYSIRLLSGDRLSVELIQERDVPRPPARHLGHYKAGLYVLEIESFQRILRERGVDVDADIFFDEALNARSFVFRDNEGNRLQAFQRCGQGC